MSWQGRHPGTEGSTGRSHEEYILSAPQSAGDAHPPQVNETRQKEFVTGRSVSEAAVAACLPAILELKMDGSVLRQDVNSEIASALSALTVLDPKLTKKIQKMAKKIGIPTDDVEVLLNFATAGGLSDTDLLAIRGSEHIGGDLDAFLAFFTLQNGAHFSGMRPENVEEFMVRALNTGREAARPRGGQSVEEKAKRAMSKVLMTLPAGDRDDMRQLIGSLGILGNADRIAGAHTVYTLNRSGPQYTLDELKGLLSAHRAALIANAFQATSNRNHLTFVRLCCQYNAGTDPSSAMVLLTNVQACLEDGHNTMAVYREDKHYNGGSHGDDRTGFLHFQCLDGVQVEIHTHWQESVRKLISMHVQIGGANGTEINKWEFFGSVQSAIRDAHNAAAAPLAPTGGSLSL